MTEVIGWDWSGRFSARWAGKWAREWVNEWMSWKETSWWRIWNRSKLKISSSIIFLHYIPHPTTNCPHKPNHGHNIFGGEEKRGHLARDDINKNKNNRKQQASEVFSLSLSYFYIPYLSFSMTWMSFYSGPGLTISFLHFKQTKLHCTSYILEGRGAFRIIFLWLLQFPIEVIRKIYEVCGVAGASAMAMGMGPPGHLLVKLWL